MIINISELVDNPYRTYQCRVVKLAGDARLNYGRTSSCSYLNVHAPLVAPTPGTPKARAYPIMADPVLYDRHRELRTIVNLR
jgi:hypothetical protein